MSTRVRRLVLNITIDSDGYPRRECPHCERDFKRIVARGSNPKPVQAARGGCYCPYCGLQSPSSSWLTMDQVEIHQAHRDPAQHPIEVASGTSLVELPRHANGQHSARRSLERDQRHDDCQIPVPSWRVHRRLGALDGQDTLPRLWQLRLSLIARRFEWSRARMATDHLCRASRLGCHQPIQGTSSRRCLRAELLRQL
jgi:hypothetical protein